MYFLDILKQSGANLIGIGIAIEKDKTTEPILSRIVDAADGRLTVIFDDALRVDFSKLGFHEYAICANLPYNVGTELLIGWLQKIAGGEQIKSMTLMFQREVALRITSKPGDEHYGRLAVLTSLIADSKILCTFAHSFIGVGFIVAVVAQW